MVREGAAAKWIRLASLRDWLALRSLVWSRPLAGAMMLAMSDAQVRPDSSVEDCRMVRPSVCPVSYDNDATKGDFISSIFLE